MGGLHVNGVKVCCFLHRQVYILHYKVHLKFEYTPKKKKKETPSATLLDLGCCSHLVIIRNSHVYGESTYVECKSLMVVDA
jgi:hypothetical protein